MCSSHWSNQIGCWRIKIANIGPIGGLKTGFHSLDKLCGSHTANQVFWSVHLVLSRFATRSPGLRMQTFYLSGKYQDQNILGTLFRHPWTVCYLIPREIATMFFSDTKGNQFHVNLSMCLYSNLSIFYIRGLFTKREVMMAGYILYVNAEPVIFCRVLQNVKGKRLSVQTSSENFICRTRLRQNMPAAW